MPYIIHSLNQTKNSLQDSLNAANRMNQNGERYNDGEFEDIQTLVTESQNKLDALKELLPKVRP